MRALACGFALAAMVSSAAAAPPRLDRLHEAINSAAAATKSSLRVSFAGCETRPVVECSFSAPPSTRITANAESRDHPVEQLGAYLPPERRSNADVASLLTTMIAAFSPQVPARERGRVVEKLLDGAIGRARRGEKRVRDVTYVLRANDGTDVRVYVTWR